MFGASSKLASVMELGYNTTKTLKTKFDKLGTVRIQDTYNFRA